MRASRCWLIAMLMGSALASADTVQASSTVLNLRTALLVQTDAPNGFARAHVHTTRHFALQLTVTIQAAQSQLNASCALDKSFPAMGWSQGLIEAFDHSSALAALQVCASLFRAPSGAGSAYRLLVQRDVKTLIKLKTATPLVMTQIGNRSAGMVRQIKECSCSTTALLRTYNIVYQHGNAVVEATYTGPARFTPDDFVRLVVGENNKIR